MESGLYIVATPIGNLKDITLRAIDILSGVDVIAAEDTRHSRKLLDSLGISSTLISLHEHNEQERTKPLLDRISSGESVALISDAGTPLISDPGGRLVQSARDQGLKVIPVPGPSAVIAALSASGIDCRKFVFEGFVPAKAGQRKGLLDALRLEERAVVFYESPHRILATLKELAEFYPERTLVLARELTKTFETIVRDSAEKVLEFVKSDANQRKGEFVLILEGVRQEKASQDWELAQRLLEPLLAELPPKKAAAIVAEVTGIKKNELYAHTLSIKKKN